MCVKGKEKIILCVIIYLYSIYIYIDISKTTNRIGREEKTRV